MSWDHTSSAGCCCPQASFFKNQSGIGRIPKSVQQYSEDLACWVGSIYRLLHIKTGLPSSVIADRIPFKDMAVAYLGMHTIDDELALDNLIKGRLQIKA